MGVDGRYPWIISCLSSELPLESPDNEFPEEEDSLFLATPRCDCHATGKEGYILAQSGPSLSNLSVDLDELPDLFLCLWGKGDMIEWMNHQGRSFRKYYSVLGRKNEKQYQNSSDLVWFGNRCIRNIPLLYSTIMKNIPKLTADPFLDQCLPISKG